jgi:hypothetical protein
MAAHIQRRVRRTRNRHSAGAWCVETQQTEIEKKKNGADTQKRQKAIRDGKKGQSTFLYILAHSIVVVCVLLTLPCRPTGCHLYSLNAVAASYSFSIQEESLQPALSNITTDNVDAHKA